VYRDKERRREAKGFAIRNNLEIKDILMGKSDMDSMETPSLDEDALRLQQLGYKQV
jgi:hypothetical protein